MFLVSTILGDNNVPKVGAFLETHLHPSPNIAFNTGSVCNTGVYFLMMLAICLNLALKVVENITEDFCSSLWFSFVCLIY